MLSPRETGAFIASKGKHAFLAKEGICDAAGKIYTQMKEEKYSFSIWKESPVHPKVMNTETIDWIFVVDSLNFSFWLPGEKQYQLEYDGNVYEDYEALCNGINRAIKEEIPITSPSYYKDVTLETIEHVFRSCNGTTLPLLAERTRNLNEAGEILCRDYKGSFSNVITECKCDVKLLISKVTNLFSSFRDTSIYYDQPVSFYKRAQILIADTWACFEGQGYGQFDNIKELTMFADYRVPQSLLALGILKYSDKLLDKVRKGVILDSRSSEEMEIRGCSIHCVELLREEIEKMIQSDTQHISIDINSVIIDFYLWGYATQNAEDMKDYPEHKTRSIYY